MIIYLDKTVAVHFSEFELTEKEIIFLNQLAISYQKGNCIVCGDLSSLETIVNKTDGICSSIFKKIQSLYPTTRAIVSLVDCVFVFSYSNGENIPDFIKEKAIFLQIQETINYNLFEPCTIIGENLNDCKFYQTIGYKYIHEKNITGVSLSFHPECGGGTTSEKVFEKCIKTDKSFTLCLVDSDIKYGCTKKFPSKPPKGDTAKKLEKMFKELKEENILPTYFLYCIPSHEVENLIPIDILDEFANKKSLDAKNGVNALKRLSENGFEDSILLYDFKKGEHTEENSPRSVYWNEIGKKIGNYEFPFIGKNVLEFFLDTIDEKYNFKIDSYLLEIWDKIGRLIITWGCANHPIRA